MRGRALGKAESSGIFGQRAEDRVAERGGVTGAEDAAGLLGVKEKKDIGVDEFLRVVGEVGESISGKTVGRPVIGWRLRATLPGPRCCAR